MRAWFPPQKISPEQKASFSFIRKGKDASTDLEPFFSSITISPLGDDKTP